MLLAFFSLGHPAKSKTSEIQKIYSIGFLVRGFRYFFSMFVNGEQTHSSNLWDSNPINLARERNNMAAVAVSSGSLQSPTNLTQLEQVTSLLRRDSESKSDRVDVGVLEPQNELDQVVCGVGGGDREVSHIAMTLFSRGWCFRLSLGAFESRVYCVSDMCTLVHCDHECICICVMMPAFST
jgi:hypothetical protein